MPRPQLLRAAPIWKMEGGATPVGSLDPALTWFTRVLGFRIQQQDARHARIIRDSVVLELHEDPQHDPATAGSCAIRTDDLAGLHAELATSGAAPGTCEEREHDGVMYRMFFVRESQNGYCFLFSQPLREISKSEGTAGVPPGG